jgi:hypothetical protein
MAPIPVVVPICVMTFRDVVRPSVQSALRDYLRWTHGRRYRATIMRDVGSNGSIRPSIIHRLPGWWMTHWRESRPCAGKVRNAAWEARSSKADSTAAHADSASNVPGSQSATAETATTKTSSMKATAAAMEATTTTEAASTTAPVPSRRCYGTERHEGSASY